MARSRTEIVEGPGHSRLSRPTGSASYAEARNEPSTSLEWTQALLSPTRARRRGLRGRRARGGTDHRDRAGAVRRERLFGVLRAGNARRRCQSSTATHSDLLGACDRADVVAAMFAAFDASRAAGISTASAGCDSRAASHRVCGDSSRRATGPGAAPRVPVLPDPPRRRIRPYLAGPQREVPELPEAQDPAARIDGSHRGAARGRRDCTVEEAYRGPAPRSNGRAGSTRTARRSRPCRASSRSTGGSARNPGAGATCT